MTQTSNQQKFRLENFLIKESHIKRNPVKQGKFEMEIIPHGRIDKAKDLFNLHLIIELRDSNDSFNAKVHSIGIFSLNYSQIFSRTT